MITKASLEAQTQTAIEELQQFKCDIDHVNTVRAFNPPIAYGFDIDGLIAYHESVLRAMEAVAEGEPIDVPRMPAHLVAELMAMDYEGSM